jgi:hypothetical protein
MNTLDANGLTPDASALMVITRGGSADGMALDVCAEVRTRAANARTLDREDSQNELTSTCTVQSTGLP